MFLITKSFETHSQLVTALTREDRCGQHPVDAPWDSGQSPWWREPSGLPPRPHPEKGRQPVALTAAYTWRHGQCTPHAALESSQLRHQILYLEGDEQRQTHHFIKHVFTLKLEPFQKQQQRERDRGPRLTHPSTSLPALIAYLQTMQYDWPAANTVIIIQINSCGFLWNNGS